MHFDRFIPNEEVGAPEALSTRRSHRPQSVEPVAKPPEIPW
jgi:hypothetical protein